MQTFRLLSEGETRHIYSRLKVRGQKFASCESFLKVSVVFPRYKLLGSEGGLWSVFLSLSAHKLMNEIVEKSESYLAGIRKDRFGDTSLPLSTMVSVQPRGFEGQKNRKKILRLVNVVMPGLPAEIFLAINVVVFAGAG